MAKQKKTFADIMDKIQKVIPEAEIVGETNSFKINNYVSTGSYIVNAQISGSIFKGIPEGRMLLLAGDSGTGKTFFALNSCREAQKLGYHIWWLDSEGAVDDDMLVRMGINTKAFSLIPVGKISEASQVLTNLLDEFKDMEDGHKNFIVLDSIGNLSSDKEDTDLKEGNQKRDMTKQQELKALFRVLMNRLRLRKVPMIAVTHVYDTIGGYIPMKNISGGTGSIYGASITLMLSKSQLKENDMKTGVIITVKQEKSRFTQAGINAKVHVSFSKGMNKYVGLQDYLDYDVCGVGAGKLVEEIIEEVQENGKVKKVKTGNMIYEKDDTDKPKYYAVRHLNKHFKAKDLFPNSKLIFSNEVLEALDENIIRKTFEFPDFKEDYEDLETDAWLSDSNDEDTEE